MRQTTTADTGWKTADGGGKRRKKKPRPASPESSKSPPSTVTSGSPAVAAGNQPDNGSVLQLHGARTLPSALLRLDGAVLDAGGRTVPVQPMVDSGASGMEFVDSAFARQCGAALQPSSQQIALADGTVVRAEGEVTLNL